MILDKCTQALTPETETVESLASSEQSVDAKALAERAALRARQRFMMKLWANADGYLVVPEGVSGLDARLAVAEQQFLNRGHKNDPNWVAVLAQFADAQIERSHPSLEKLQKVIDESVAWSRERGVLQRLELREQTLLAGDAWGRIDVYGPPRLPVVRRLWAKLKSAIVPTQLTFVRAESLARELGRLDTELRLPALKRAISQAAPALTWEEVLHLIQALEPPQRGTGLKFLRSWVFTPLYFFEESITKELDAVATTPKKWGSKVGVALGATAVLGLTGVVAAKTWEGSYAFLASEDFILKKDGMKFSDRIKILEVFSDNEKRGQAITSTISAEDFQRLSVSQVIQMVDTFKTGTYSKNKDQEVGAKWHDALLKKYAETHPHLSADDRVKLAKQACYEEARDAILRTHPLH